MLASSTVVVAAPQAYAAPLPNTLTITVTKDATQSVQSVAVLPLDIDNAQGYSTLIKVSASTSELTPSQGTLASPQALTDNSFGFALEGNPAAQTANLVPNGHWIGYSAKESVPALAEPYAGLTTTPEAVLHSGTPGQSSANLYLSARVAPTLAAGDYHVTLNVESVATIITTVAGTINWDDNDNQDGIRPTTVTVELYKTVSGTRTLTTKVATLTTTDNPWAYRFNALPIEENGEPIIYDVKSTPVPGYTSAQTADDFIYTHVPGTTSLAGTITWSDDNDSEGLRPASVGLELYRSVGGGVPTLVSGVTPTLTTSTYPWTYSFDALPEYEGGQAVTYTAQAATPLPLGYTAAKTGDNFTYSHALGSGILRVEGSLSPYNFLYTGRARSAIKSIVFSNTLPPVGILGTDTWDVSAAGDDTVRASWDSSTLTMTIGATGGVYANMDSYALFYGLSALTALNLDNLHAERATDMRCMFESATLPANLSFPAGFGSQATNMSSMFFGTSLPTGFSLPANFGSQATSMANMFWDATLPAGFSFSTLTGFGSQAINMSGMFRNFTLPTGLGFPAGFGSVATDMTSMFQTATLPADPDFPAGFGSQATDMSSMFYRTSLPTDFSLPANFGSQATSMANMFNGATLQAGFSLPANFGTKAANMDSMFRLATLPDGLTFPASFGPAATIMNYMFAGATLQGNLNWSQATFATTQLDGLTVPGMFSGTNFGSGYTITVADAAVLTKFTTGTTATTDNIVVSP